ncbi:hypothetical protein GFD17_02690 [Bifidobacterium sp. SMB2]|nr:hypothetical protein [Bifidobacterium sp. SMB2]NEG95677.1 hypothetical protein [Bifidobacterium sp. SMB2]
MSAQRSSAGARREPADRRLTVRFPRRRFEQLDVFSGGMPRARFVRQCVESRLDELLGEPHTPVAQPAEWSPFDDRELARLALTVNRIGVNWNQLVRATNAGKPLPAGAFTADDVARFGEVWRDMRRMFADAGMPLGYGESAGHRRGRVK